MIFLRNVDLDIWGSLTYLTGMMQWYLATMRVYACHTNLVWQGNGQLDWTLYSGPHKQLGLHGAVSCPRWSEQSQAAWWGSVLLTILSGHHTGLGQERVELLEEATQQWRTRKLCSEREFSRYCEGHPLRQGDKPWEQEAGALFSTVQGRLQFRWYYWIQQQRGQRVEKQIAGQFSWASPQGQNY